MLTNKQDGKSKENKIPPSYPADAKGEKKTKANKELTHFDPCSSELLKDNHV